jgi:hypothetical protein
MYRESVYLNAASPEAAFFAHKITLFYIRPKLGAARRRFFGGSVLLCPFLINSFLGGH